jgi:hypothetical protein
LPRQNHRLVFDFIANLFQQQLAGLLGTHAADAFQFEASLVHQLA